jgi:hypothetical protein
MSTHSALGIRRPDGSIAGTYVHFDGYPSHMEEAIEDYLEEYSAKELLSLIEEAQDVGGIRIFHHRRDPDLHGRTERLTELFRDDEGYFIDESNWSDDHMSTYAWYLIDEATGELETRLKYPEVS